MIADITHSRIPGYDISVKTLDAINRKSIPVNLVLPPYKSDDDPSPILETPNVLLPATVDEFLERAAKASKF